MKKLVLTLAISLAVSGITSAHAGPFRSLKATPSESDFEPSCESKLVESSKVQDDLRNIAAECLNEKADFEWSVASLKCQLDCYQPHPKTLKDGFEGAVEGLSGGWLSGPIVEPICPQKPGLFGASLIPDACTSCLQKCRE